MKKLFVLMSLMLLLAPAAAFARTIGAYNYYGNTQSVSHNTYDRYQVVRVGSNGFTRTVDAVRHNLSVRAIDGTKRKITFEEHTKGQIIKTDVPFDNNNLGTLTIGTRSYPFQVDMKHKSISIGYGLAVSTI
jgi:hypothetical protein